MNKHLLKQTINYLNEFSLGFDSDLVQKTYAEVLRQDQTITTDTIINTINYLEDINALEWLGSTLDMFPSTVVFGRSNPNSDIEALSAYEMALRSKKPFDDISIQKLLSTTKLFENGEIRDDLKPFAQRIAKEVDYDIISETLNILYTKIIVQRKANTEYRNQELSTVEFLNKDFIMQIIPQKGIPISREATKDLQTFFKDTQMHEFDHACPICHAKMPQMLIASHIKPFRDCAHIYETATHDNGLLLCRNHDFLFDQGYISFDDNGYLIISDALIEKDSEVKHFNLCEKLETKYLTENRIKFLKYHRENILKK